MKINTADIIGYIRELYLNDKDIDALVNDPKLSLYFDTAMDSIPLSDFHQNNPEEDRKQFAKKLFIWINNYGNKLDKPPEKFAKIVFDSFYGLYTDTFKYRDAIMKLN